MESGYQQEQMGGGRVRFTVTPASAPRNIGAPLALAILFALVVIGSRSPSEGQMGWILRSGVALGGGVVAHRLLGRWLVERVDRRRSPGGSFVVSAASIEAAAGTVLPRERIRRLVVRNGTPRVIAPIVVNVGTVYAGSPASVRDGAAAVSFMLCAESGGDCTTLGGGMSETTALGLLTDVSRILSLAGPGRYGWARASSTAAIAASRARRIDAGGCVPTGQE